MSDTEKLDIATRTDLRLMCRAVTDGYPMSDETRGKVVKRLSDALDLPLSARELVRVCMALVSIDKARLAALTASKPDQSPTVVIHSSGPQKDTLAELIDMMTPEEAQEWLNCFGERMAATTRNAATESAPRAKA